jgi:hypothetical protein
VNLSIIGRIASLIVAGYLGLHAGAPAENGMRVQGLNATNGFTNQGLNATNGMNPQGLNASNGMSIQGPQQAQVQSPAASPKNVVVRMIGIILAQEEE